VSDTVGTSAAKGRVAPHESLFAWLVARLGDPRARFAQAFETEIAERRLFLWLPAAAGLGVVLALEADRDPSLWFAGAGFLVCGGLAAILRGHRAACAAAVGIAAVFAGFLSAGWRSARVAAPVLDHIRIATLEGRIEQMDFRRAGARFILRCDKMEGLTADARPKRVRLTIRRAPPFEAGTYVRVKARLVPPAQASLPGGYDFARDAWFAELGAVGNVLGRMDAIEAPTSSDLFSAAAMALDRGRNALARRVDQIIGGDAGAIGAAMVARASARSALFS
jgi:competence protein ComEC